MIIGADGIGLHANFKHIPINNKCSMQCTVHGQANIALVINNSHVSDAASQDTMLPKYEQLHEFLLLAHLQGIALRVNRTFIRGWLVQ